MDLEPLSDSFTAGSDRRAITKTSETSDKLIAEALLALSSSRESVQKLADEATVSQQSSPSFSTAEKTDQAHGKATTGAKSLAPQQSRSSIKSVRGPWIPDKWSGDFSQINPQIKVEAELVREWQQNQKTKNK